MSEPPAPAHWSEHGPPPQWYRPQAVHVDPLELMQWRNLVSDTLGYHRGRFENLERRFENLERRLEELERRRGPGGEATGKLVIAALAALAAALVAMVWRLLGFEGPL